MVNVFIVDDHPMLIDGVKSVFAKNKDEIKIVGTATSAVNAMKKLKQSNANVVLLDLVMPGMSGVELCAWISNNLVELKIIAFTAETNKALLLNALKNGANAILLKHCGKQEIVDTIYSVLKGNKIFGTGVPDLRADSGLISSGKKVSLTPREHQVLSKMAVLGSRSQVAEALCMKKNSLDFHCKNILKKFNEHNMITVVKEAREANLII